MDADRMLWREQYLVRTYELDLRGSVSVRGVCNYLQDAAGNHAQALGVAVEQLQKHKVTWVLSRLHVQLRAYPRWREKILVETWPASVDKLYAVRDFLLLDAAENVIGAATSAWLLIDIEKRRPVRLPSFIGTMHRSARGRVIPDPFEKLPVPADSTAAMRFQVCRADLDLNQHVNNVKYIDWLLEQVPDDVWRHRQLRTLEIDFRSESVLGDHILSQTVEMQGNPREQVFVHRLFRETDRRELVRARTVWDEA